MTDLAHALRATPALARISVARHVAYRAEMTIWILTAILPLIMLAMWDAVVGSGSIASYGRDELWRYFAATLICRQLTGAWVVWELSYAIRMGQLSPQLLRPFHPLYAYAVWMITAMPFRIAILSPILVGLAFWRPDLISLPEPAALALFLPSILLAWVLAFLVQCAFGLLAFWVDKSDGLFNMWQAVWALLSGYVAPLAFFPEAMQPVLQVLPFRAMLAAPVELLAGFTSPADAWMDLGLQLFWTAVAALVVRMLWTRGLARYGAFGA